MASGTRLRLLGDVAVSVTGVVGRDGQDGQPPGTVWIGVDDRTTASAQLFTTSGSSAGICALRWSEALRHGAVRPEGA
jgi:nicotinamide-nucleotide amidase